MGRRYGHSGKVDANQPALVDKLRRLGFKVRLTSSLGDGGGDIIVGCRGANWMFEIKDPDKPPSGRTLTGKEPDFHATWTGQIHVIETAEDALRIMGVMV